MVFSHGSRKSRLKMTSCYRVQGKENVQRGMPVMMVAELQRRGYTIVCTFKRHDRPNAQDLFWAADRRLRNFCHRSRLPCLSAVRFSDAAEHYDDTDLQVGLTAGLNLRMYTCVVQLSSSAKLLFSWKPQLLIMNSDNRRILSH